MKLAALQLMQQKANKQEKECPAVTENGGSSPADGNATESSKALSEDGKAEGTLCGLDQTRNLAESIASEDETGTLLEAALWNGGHVYGCGGALTRISLNAFNTNLAHKTYSRQLPVIPSAFALKTSISVWLKFIQTIESTIELQS